MSSIKTRTPNLVLLKPGLKIWFQYLVTWGLVCFLLVSSSLLLARASSPLTPSSRLAWSLLLHQEFFIILVISEPVLETIFTGKKSWNRHRKKFGTGKQSRNRYLANLVPDLIFLPFFLIQKIYNGYRYRTGTSTGNF